MNKTPLAQKLYDEKVLHEDFLRRKVVDWASQIVARKCGRKWIERKDVKTAINFLQKYFS
ncbi:MAG: hypothetical protein KJ604_20625 [Gammaproteobacteria bacterium]|nr:hypothetical protein [Gammaproteobacteria bacterium]